MGGVTVRGILVVVSDGENNNSRNSLANVQQVSKAMLNEEIFTLAFFAFGPEGRGEAGRMGFPSVMETGNSGSEMRRALQVVSKSTIRASQNQINASGANFFNP